jgi:excisionase family DNA binding protein
MPPPLPDLELRRAPDAIPKHLDEDEQATLTLTIPQAAGLLRISLHNAYEAARLGQMPTIRLGTRILVSRRRLEEMVNGSAQELRVPTRRAPVRKAGVACARVAPA